MEKVGKNSGMAMEQGMSNMESKVASGNLQQGTITEKLIAERNMKRNKQHLGMMPPKGSGKF